MISRRSPRQNRRYRLMAGAGGAGPFNPGSVANMTLWLKSDVGVTQSGGFVSAWADQSGLGNNYAQPTGSTQPAFVASAINGLPGLTFDGVDDQMDGPLLSGLITASAYSLFIVLKPVTIAASSGTSYLNDAILGEAGGYGLAYLDAGGGTPKAVAGNFQAAADSIVEQNLVATTNAYIHAQRHSGGNLFISVNSNAETSVASTDTGSLAGLTSIGRGNITGHFGNFTVSEILCWKVDLDTQNAGDRARVLNYLKTKYGTP